MTSVAFLDGLFIETLSTDPVYYLSWVVTVVVSVVLHELGHGFAALSQGDDTPRRLGRMTLDPLVHMGPVSLVALVVAGIAWGAMPVDPSRFRHRWSGALVAFAGPAVNLVLALVGLTALGLWARSGGVVEGGFAEKAFTFVLVFGVANVVLFLLNLVPVPPLDGSAVLGGFSRTWRRWTDNPDNQGLFTAFFVGVFLAAGTVFSRAAAEVSHVWVGWIVGL